MKQLKYTMAHLKLIATISMLLDHVGAVLVGPMMDIKPQLTTLYWFLRLIGRLAFPLFAFGIAQGIKHTHSKKKYALRMLIFALISEPCFDLAASHQLFDLNQQNAMATFLIAIVAITLFEFYQKTNFLNWLIVILGAIMAELCQCDYGAMGVLLVFCFYYFPDHSIEQIFSALLLTLPQMTAPIALGFIERYNQQKGIEHKFFHYVFYPLHLIILYFIYQRLITSFL